MGFNYDNIILDEESFANKLQKGRLRESNPGPPAPEAGIIPLDQGDLRDFKDKIKT